MCDRWFSSTQAFSMADHPHQPQLPPWREELTFTPSWQHLQGRITMSLVYDPTSNTLVRDPEYNDELAAEAVASSSQGLPSSGQETEDESFNHAIEGIEHFFSNYCQSRGRVQDPLQPSSHIGFLFQICLEELLREDATNFGLE
jgi:hypothetical protein